MSLFRFLYLIQYSIHSTQYTQIVRYLQVCKTTILTKQLEIRAEFDHVDIKLPATRPQYQADLLQNYLTQAEQRYNESSEYVVRMGEGVSTANIINQCPREMYSKYWLH